MRCVEDDPTQLALASPSRTERTSHISGLGPGGRCARGHVSVTHNQHRLQRGPALEPPTRMLGRRRPRWRDWAKEIKNKMTFCRRRKEPPAEPSKPRGKSPYPRASRTAPTFRAECALPQKVEWNGGMGGGF